MNPRMIGEQGPDMIPLTAIIIIITICSDSDVASLTYLERVVKFRILFYCVYAGNSRPTLPRKALLVEFRYFSVSFQNYTSATKSE